MSIEKVGLLKEATIVGFDKESNTIDIQLSTSVAAKGQSKISIPAPAPNAYFQNNGLFIGSSPTIGTPIIVGQGSGNQYYFVSFKPNNIKLLPKLNKDELLIRTSDTNKITLDTSNNIKIGSDINKINISTGNINKPKTNLISFNFENEFHFTQATRKVDGIVKRDLKINKIGFDQDSKLENDNYDPYYYTIGMDPSATSNDIISGPTKNPPFIENRELIYEFQYQSDIKNDLTESLQYNSISYKDNYNMPNRRKSRADTLSLTLLEPNYLMETIKGTVVDIFGNILDLNRMPLPVGLNDNTIRAELNANKQKAFLKIKELERKSIAYHFEINARKDFSNKSNKLLDLLDINSNKNNSRLRSRFSLDIDKEGQVKLNIPASSEKGNIPLLTRYENLSTYSPEDNGNPNKLLYNKNNLDIYLDSFAASKVTLKDKDQIYSKEKGSIALKSKAGEAGPIDRITKSHIKHGTAHHDILKTCWTFQNHQHLDLQYGTSVNSTVDLNLIPLLKDIVSDTIIVEGDGLPESGGPNAGGRSLSANLDGMLELNIGANTVDRQSLWMDLAGGSVINLGRDKRKRSAIVGADGDIYLQVGSFGISGDQRFEKQANGIYGAVLDIRVLNAGGRTHIFRVDNNGITVMTPGNMAIHATGNLKISSDSNIEIDCETFVIQERMVLKGTGGSI